MGVLSYLKSKLTTEEKKQLQWLLAQADKWREPNGPDYRDEIERRREYLDGEMEDDGLELLKKEFPKSWRDMEYKMLQYPIPKLIVEKKAQVFRGRGARFFLRDRLTKEEVEPNTPAAKSFAYMVESSNLQTNLVDIDRTLEMMHCCAGRVGWGIDGMEEYVYDPDKVHIAVNPDHENNAYAASAVLFERTGFDGISSTSPRYEFWGDRAPDIIAERDAEGRALFSPSMHYMLSMDDRAKINADDVNPYKSRTTGKPIYPFTWFRDNRRSVYDKGGDDLVRLGRVINLGLTYLHHNMIWQMAASPMFELPASGVGEQQLERLKNIIMSAPNKALQVPPGVKFSFVRPDVQLGPFVEVYEMLIQYAALMNHLSPRSIDVRNGLPQSGIAMRIEFDGLIRHRDERVNLYRPHVLDYLEKRIVVWNMYAPRDLNMTPIPDRLVADWEPGHMESGPTDYVELNDRFEKQIDANVSNYYEWCAAINGIDLKSAEERVKDNATINQELRKMMTRYPEEPPEPDLENVPVDGPEEESNGGTGGVDEANADKIVANVYQIVKAIEVGAATAVDLRMALYPDETRDVAERIVRDNQEFNLEMAELTGRVKAAEAEAAGSGQPPKTGDLPKPPPAEEE